MWKYWWNTSICWNACWRGSSFLNLSLSSASNLGSADLTEIIHISHNLHAKPAAALAGKDKSTFSWLHIIDNSNLSSSPDRQVPNCVLKITGRPRYVSRGWKDKACSRENNASIHQVQLHGRDIKLERSSSSFGMGGGVCFSLTGRDCLLPVTTIWMKTWGRLKNQRNNEL